MPRLLIVDSEPGIRSLLTLAFLRAGYVVKTAASALQTKDFCAAEDFDVVLSDAQMPGMDCRSLVGWLARTRPRARPVLMSAFDPQCDACPVTRRCKLLPKPFVPTVAVATVAEVLSRCAN